MQWPFRKKNLPDDEIINGEDDSRTESQSYHSPGLLSTVIHLRDGRKYKILDLGKAAGPTIDFFSKYSCRLHIADIVGQIAGISLSGKQEDSERLLRELAPGEDGEFDLIFAWDIFNYLSRRQFQILSYRLAQLGKPGSKMLAFILAENGNSCEPSIYKIVEKGSLIRESMHLTGKQAKWYSPGEVKQLMSGFEVDKAFQLRHGIQEYILIRKTKIGDNPGPESKTNFKSAEQKQ